LLIDIHLADEFPTIGAGHRRFVTWTGRKNAYLFHPPSLLTLTVPKAVLEKLRPREVKDYAPRALIKSIKRNRKTREGLGMFDGGRSADKALDVLREVKL